LGQGVGEYSLQSFAKLNLSLKIFPPRPDGYHPLRSVFQTISLHDILTVKIKKATHPQLILTCSDPAVPVDDANIIAKIFKKYPIPFEFVVHIQKNIPSAAGLGGGSSNGAAFLSLLGNRKAGPEFGADVPFFFVGGTALVEGIGEKVTPTPSDANNFYLLLNPGIHLSTTAVYKKFDEMPPDPEQENMLKPAAFALAPDLLEIEYSIRSLADMDVSMSGSGSTLFLSFQDGEKARYLEKKLRRNFPNFFIFLAQKSAFPHRIEKHAKT
jgi:4-diphosphocytidyl-2-C-methyl-D-erythritol kinase